MCFDGTAIFEASLNILDPVSGVSVVCRYSLPEKLGRWMRSGELAHIRFRTKKHQSSWCHATHWVHEGDPVFEMWEGNGRTCYRYSMGRGGKVGRAHRCVDGRSEEVRDVVFQANGPICPFLGLVLPQGVQSHLLGEASYMMPLLTSTTKSGLPAAEVTEVDRGEGQITFQWYDDGGQGRSYMRLT